MKLLRSMAVVVILAFIIVSLAGVSFAAEKMHHKDMQQSHQAKIKALKDSAAILEKTNPDLAKGLNDLAAQKEKMMQEMQEMKAKDDAKVKLLRDSAAALQKSNPDLAKDLWDMSEMKGMKKGWGGKKMCPMCMEKCKECGQ